MSNSITIIKEMYKTIRTLFVDLSGINPDLIRHIDTEYGVDLNKNPNGSIFSTITHKDLILLFDISPANIESNMTETQGNHIHIYNYYKVKCIMYGDDSITKSLILTSKLRSEKIRDLLIEKGIHLAEVSNIEKLEEIQNGSIWVRCDFDLLIACEISIDDLDNYQIESYSDIDIYEN